MTLLYGGVYVKDVNGSVLSMDSLSVFTRTPDALYGLSHISLSPEHSLNQPHHYKVCWLAALQAIGDPCYQAACLWLSVRLSVIDVETLMHIFEQIF